MPASASKDGPPAVPCGTCSGRRWWRTSKTSHIWRCSVCFPPDRVMENRRPPRGLEHVTARDG